MESRPFPQDVKETAHWGIFSVMAAGGCWAIPVVKQNILSTTNTYVQTKKKSLQASWNK